MDFSYSQKIYVELVWYVKDQFFLSLFWKSITKPILLELRNPCHFTSFAMLDECFFASLSKTSLKFINNSMKIFHDKLHICIVVSAYIYEWMSFFKVTSTYVLILDVNYLKIVSMNMFAKVKPTFFLLLLYKYCHNEFYVFWLQSSSVFTKSIYRKVLLEANTKKVWVFFWVH